MKFLKHHIKIISITTLAAGGALSIAGFITFLVGGTYNVVELTGTKTIGTYTEYLTASHATGWLNFDSHYWSNKYGLIDSHGKKIILSFEDFLLLVNEQGFIDEINKNIETQKQLQASTNNLIEQTKYQYAINYWNGLLNANSQYLTALIGVIIFPLGISISALITLGLVMLQKQAKHKQNLIEIETQQ